MQKAYQRPVCCYSSDGGQHRYLTVVRANPSGHRGAGQPPQVSWYLSLLPQIPLGLLW